MTSQPAYIKINAELTKLLILLILAHEPCHDFNPTGAGTRYLKLDIKLKNLMSLQVNQNLIEEQIVELENEEEKDENIPAVAVKKAGEAAEKAKEANEAKKAAAAALLGVAVQSSPLP